MVDFSKYKIIDSKIPIKDIKKNKRSKNAVKDIKKKSISRSNFESVTDNKYLPSYNKSLELNLIKSLYANRYGTTTNKLKTDIQKAIMNIWQNEL